MMNSSQEEYGKNKLRELIVIFLIGVIGVGIFLYFKTGIPILKIIIMCSALLLFWSTLLKLIWLITKTRNK
ncbi:hypothetical protein GCM10028791_05010 [Echinicola sediminis]